MTKLNVEKVKEGIKGSAGVIAIIAKQCGVSRQAMYEFLEKNPKLKEDVKQESERIIDLGESELFKLVKKGEFPAIKYLLSTKGKKRGYVEKQELTHSTDIDWPVEIIINPVNKKKVKKK